MSMEQTEKYSLQSMAAGVGIGIAGTSVVIALHWICTEFLPWVGAQHERIWEIDPTWTKEFLVVMVVSCIWSIAFFRLLHVNQAWKGDANDHLVQKRRRRLLLSMISGISAGVGLRVIGGIAFLYHDIYVMEKKGVMYLGDYGTPQQFFVGVIAFTIAGLSLCLSGREH